MFCTPVLKGLHKDCGWVHYWTNQCGSAEFHLLNIQALLSKCLKHVNDEITSSIRLLCYVPVCIQIFLILVHLFLIWVHTFYGV